MVFQWSLSDSKFPQVTRILSILADNNNDVIWMVSICPLIFKSSSSFTSPLGIVPSALILTDIIVIILFYIYFCSLDRSRYLSFAFSFNFTMWSTDRFSFFVDYHYATTCR